MYGDVYILHLLPENHSQWSMTYNVSELAFWADKSEGRSSSNKCVWWAVISALYQAQYCGHSMARKHHVHTLQQCHLSLVCLYVITLWSLLLIFGLWTVIWCDSDLIKNEFPIGKALTGSVGDNMWYELDQTKLSYLSQVVFHLCFPIHCLILGDFFAANSNMLYSWSHSCN